MTAHTLIDKIWDAHRVAALGDGLDLVYVDRHLLHDLSGPGSLAALERRGLSVRRPDLTFAMLDHGVRPALQPEIAINSFDNGTDLEYTLSLEALPEIDALLRRLARALPPGGDGTIVHGDYRLGNLALDPGDPGRVVAIFDWEMSTLGDPLADLGYTLIYWTEPGDDDVFGGVDGPFLEPIEAGLAHAGREHGHPATAHDPADGDAAARVVAGGWPDRPMGGRVETPGHQPGHETCVGGLDLVRSDHREPVAESENDPGLDPRQLRRKLDVIGHVVWPGPVESPVPVNPEQIAGVRLVTVQAHQRIDTGGGDDRRVAQLGERRESDS